MRTVGILGGMGPEATVLLMQKVIGAVPARDDADHVPLIVHQNPAVPSRIRRLIHGEGDDPAPVLADMARVLEAAGAEALAMPCNTAHVYAKAVRTASALPFLDIRAATAASLPRGARVGMLASPAVRMTGVFDAAFAGVGISQVYLPDDAPLLSLIAQIKAGGAGDDRREAFRRLARLMLADCDHLLVACTELSLMTDALADLPWTDSLDCLVTEIVAFAQGSENARAQRFVPPETGQGH